MTTTKRRETARESDERIVREAGPWVYDWPGSLSPESDSIRNQIDVDRACQAAARVLSHIARRRETK